uniref:Drebrin n=1 Tax=Tetraodon nigroviridis TaxID=99883 RepID=H3CQ95_TETNG
ALYTYEDDSNDLTLASAGGGGLAEITLTFDSGRVMYGFCSLKEPNATLPRYILINWVGEDVPDARKCACASHVATIADFFQGVEVTVNASSLDDIDPAAIAQRLVNGTAVVASPVLSRLRTREDEHPDPKGTVYEKTDAQVEMKKINREEFWEQAKPERGNVRSAAAEERQRYEEERMELERIEQENREKRYREREQQIEEHRKKLQEEEEAKERLRSQTTLVTEPSLEDLQLDKKESEVEEAKAIIAQRSDNPREFFKKKERAMASSVDASPVSMHRTGKETAGRKERVSPFPLLHSGFILRTPSTILPSSALLLSALSPVWSRSCLRLRAPARPPGQPLLEAAAQLRPPSPTPPQRGASPSAPRHTHGNRPPLQPSSLVSPPPQSPRPISGLCQATFPDIWRFAPRTAPPLLPAERPPTGFGGGSEGRSLAGVASTDANICADDVVIFEPDAAPNPEQKPLLEESTPTKPVQSVAPQVREAPSSSAWESGSDNLLELWDGGTEPPASKASDPADLMDDVSQDQAPPSSAASAAKPRSLLSFDEMMDGTLCSGPEDEPASLVDLTAPDQMTLSYQHALQHAAGEELDDGQLLMTNGETLLKEGTQASEGYFSQSQEEEFGQSEESSAKPAPVFYNKPPEIDITCWDTDPVVDDEDD